MKHIRLAVVLLLCLLLVCTASVACAATKKPSKTFTAVPTIKLTDVPSGGTPGGERNDITLNVSHPGFLNLYLLDASGNVVLTIAKNLEIHSKSSTFDFFAVDDDGEILPPGTYTVSADMVSQFGVASKVVTKDTPVVASLDSKTSSKSSSKTTTTSSQKSTSDKSSSSSESSSSSKSTSSSTAKAKATPTPKPSEKLEYAKGESRLGEEGLLIGVGVSDAATQTEAGYWGLTSAASDAEIWAAITRTMIGVDVGENESAYIYDSPETGRKKLGTVSGISQGLNLIVERADGWSLVEAFRNEDGAFVRGYMKTDKLRKTEPNQNYGIVIDKATQKLTVYKDGTRLGSCSVTTGLPTRKYPHRETPAGEFITVTRRGSYEYYGKGYTRYTIRINGSYYLAELPTTKKNGTKFLEEVEGMLGEKGTRGTICIAHDASIDGGINAEWIWNMTDENKKVKVLIFDDKPRTDVPVTSN